MRFLLFIILFFTFSVSQAQPISCYGKPYIDWPTEPLTSEEKTASVKLHLAFEGDDPTSLFLYNGFTVKFDKKKKVPLWTTHKLRYDMINKQLPRGLNRQQYCIQFKQDPNLAGLKEQAHHDDYTSTGFDRGHMTPAGDFYADSLAMLESFYITNITPQTPDYNQKVMVDVENKTRAFVRAKKKDVQVITGAVYADTRGRGLTKKKIDYPSHFYKIIYSTEQGEPELYCFLFPHQFAYPDYKLKNYQVTMDEIESLAKEDFLDVLDDVVETSIEASKMDVNGFLNP